MDAYQDNEILNCKRMKTNRSKFYFVLYRCHHNIHGKCLHCIPIEPYDEEFLKNRNPPIKHMSFRAYIRKLQSAAPSDR